jgi:hypothetical protein
MISKPQTLMSLEKTWLIKWLDNYNPLIIIRMLTRWCWNWQTGMVEGHVPIGREGSTPSQRITKSFIYWINPPLFIIPALMSGFSVLFALFPKNLY